MRARVGNKAAIITGPEDLFGGCKRCQKEGWAFKSVKNCFCSGRGETKLQNFYSKREIQTRGTKPWRKKTDPTLRKK